MTFKVYKCWKTADIYPRTLGMRLKIILLLTDTLVYLDLIQNKLRILLNSLFKIATALFHNFHHLCRHTIHDYQWSRNMSQNRKEGSLLRGQSKGGKVQYHRGGSQIGQLADDLKMCPSPLIKWKAPPEESVWENHCKEGTWEHSGSHVCEET